MKIKYNVTFIGPDYTRVTLTGIDGPLYQSDIPALEKKMNEHPEHGKDGPWKYFDAVRTN